MPVAIGEAALHPNAGDMGHGSTSPAPDSSPRSSCPRSWHMWVRARLCAHRRASWFLEQCPVLSHLGLPDNKRRVSCFQQVYVQVPGRSDHLDEPRELWDN